MTIKEIKKKKAELRKQIIEARTEGDLDAIKEELTALQEAEQILSEKIDELEENELDPDAEETPDEDDTTPADEDEQIDEKSLIKSSAKKPEERKLVNMRKIESEEKQV